MNNPAIDYLNRTVWATIMPSEIHGVGVIAIRDIPRGQKITDQTLGVPPMWFRIPQSDLLQLEPEVKELVLDRALIFELEDAIFASPNAQVDLRAFMNHSKTPNTDGFCTLRRIKKGEELTEDYTSFGELSEISRKHYAGII